MAKIVYIPFGRFVNKECLKDLAILNLKAVGVNTVYQFLDHSKVYKFGYQMIYAFPTLDEALYGFTAESQVDVYKCETSDENYIENRLNNGIVYYKISEFHNATIIHNIQYECNSGSRNFGISNYGRYNNGSYNFGTNNTGIRNNGDRNDGFGNTGYSNHGAFNKGYSNNGSFNNGHTNYGFCNVGDRNNGAENIGEYNNGFGNVGEFNNGFYNVGSYNVGGFNRTDGAIGFFNTKPCKEFRIFDKKLPDKFNYIGFIKEMVTFSGLVKVMRMGAVTEEDKTDHPYKYKIGGNNERLLDVHALYYKGMKDSEKVYLYSPNSDDLVHTLKHFLPFSEEEIREGVHKVLRDTDQDED